MDRSGFKSPRPPAPRRSRSRAASSSTAGAAAVSRTASQQEQGALTASGLLQRLEGLLVAKSNEIVLAGRLGESLLTQQAELENRIRELEAELNDNENGDEFDKNDNDRDAIEANDVARRNRAARDHNQQHTYADSSDDERVNGSAIAQETRDKLHALEEELQRWERGNDEIYKVVGLPSGTGSELVRQASQASNLGGRPSTPPPPLPTSSAALPADATPASPSMSRRQRNAQHRANDIEFATEIGQSLLVEVRRLQALLSERDAHLAASKAERDGMERSMESLASNHKQLEESLDKYREENWNLEVQNQEVRTQLTDLSGNYSKVETERARLAKELSGTRETLDNQKLDSERLANQLESMKSKHETDMANMRRTNAGLQRERSDIQAAFDSAKNELALKGRGIKRSGSTASTSTMILSESGHGHPDGAGLDGEELEEDDEDVFGTNRRGTLGNRRKTGDFQDSPGGLGDSDLEGSPFARGGPELNDTEKMRGNLAHAQKTIQTLRAALIREKEARMNLKRKMKGGEPASASEDEEQEDAPTEEDEEVDENDPSSARRQTAGGRRGRGRGRGIPASRPRNALIGRLPRGVQPSRLSSEVSLNEPAEYESDRADQSVASEQQEELASFREDDDRDALRASRSSLASIDPAFADILPRSSSTQTARGAGLGSMRDNRPSSMMFAGDLDILEKLRKQEEEIAELKNRPVVETKEMAVMTDDVPPPPVPEPVVQYVEVQVPAPKPESKDNSAQTDEIPPPPIPEPIIQYVEKEVQAPKPPSADSSCQTDDLPPPPVPEPVVQYVEVQAPKPASAEIGSQTDDLPPVPDPEPRIVHVEVPVAAAKPESREFSVQTDDLPAPPVPEPVYVQVAAPKPEARDYETQTDPEPVVEKRDMASMAVPEEVQQAHAAVMTDVLSSEERGSQTDALPAIKEVVSDDADTTANLTTMHFATADEDAITPKLESTPTFPDRSGSHRPNYSIGNRSITQESSVAPSFKSFRDTEYDTATETDGDFEDARETLQNFDMRDSPSLTHFSNASHSTILRSARDSDGESEYGGSALATPRYPRASSRRPMKVPIPTREMGTSPIRELEQTEPTAVAAPVPEPIPEPVKPTTSEMATQTDAVPDPPMTSPVSAVFSEGSTSAADMDRRYSAATFGQSAGMDSRAESEDIPSVPAGSAPGGLVYLERSGLAPLTAAPLLPPSASMVSRRPSTHTTNTTGGDSFIAPPMPISPSRTRAPKLSIPPPPAGAPPKDVLRSSTTPSFRPPRPSSPPPPELLQRAQTPTFLAPGSVRKRASASESGTATTPAGKGNMLSSRDEQQYGASPAPFPHNKPPRAVASVAQLRNAPPIRYHTASTEPTSEFGTRAQGASTPINQMRPSSRAASTRKKGTVSRASMSSVGSAHSRNHSIASSRTSDAGEHDLPEVGRTPGRARGASSNGTPGNSTDPAILHNITQTMIGDYLFKYTRNSLTGNLSEKRHQRFFWIHPYTKTLYWGTLDPGSVKVNESKSKSVFIAGVRVEADSNPNPPGLYQKSIIVHTGQREIKLTAASKEKHDMWLSAINYLLARPDGTPPTPAAAGPGTPSSTRFSLGRSITRSASSMRFRQRSDPMTLAEVGYNLSRSNGSGPNDSTVVPKSRTTARQSSAGMYLQDAQSEPKLTPKPTKGRKSTGAASVMKRSDTPAAEYQNYINEFGSPRSVRSYGRPPTSMSMNPDDSLEVIDRREALGGTAGDGDIGYEGLENVRACCNGAHDVGKLSVSKKHHHHHHNHAHGKPDDASSRASRTNTVTSRSSKRTTFSTMTTEHPPLPQRLEEPGSPSLRASTMLRGRNNSSHSGTSVQNVFRSSSPLPGATGTGTGTATAKGKSRA